MLLWRKTASSESLDTSAALEIKGDLAAEKLRVVGCSQGNAVRRKLLPVLRISSEATRSLK